MMNRVKTPDPQCRFMIETVSSLTKKLEGQIEREITADLHEESKLKFLNAIQNLDK